MKNMVSRNDTLCIPSTVVCSFAVSMFLFEFTIPQHFLQWREHKHTHYSILFYFKIVYKAIQHSFIFSLFHVLLYNTFLHASDLYYTTFIVWRLGQYDLCSDDGIKINGRLLKYLQDNLPKLECLDVTCRQTSWRNDDPWHDAISFGKSKKL